MLLHLGPFITFRPSTGVTKKKTHLSFISFCFVLFCFLFLFSFFSVLDIDIFNNYSSSPNGL